MNNLLPEEMRLLEIIRAQSNSNVAAAYRLGRKTAFLEVGTLIEDKAADYRKKKGLGGR